MKLDTLLDQFGKMGARRPEGSINHDTELVSDYRDLRRMGERNSAGRRKKQEYKQELQTQIETKQEHEKRQDAQNVVSIPSQLFIPDAEKAHRIHRIELPTTAPEDAFFNQFGKARTLPEDKRPSAEDYAKVF